MKKIAVLIISLLSLTSEVLAADKGLGIRVGLAANDPKTLEEYYNSAFDRGFSEAELTKGKSIIGLEALEEWEVSDEINKVGVKLGFDLYGNNNLSLDQGYAKVKEISYAVPLTVYYKQDLGIKRLSWFIGGGVSLIKTKVTLTEPGVRESYSKHKFFPHITAGVEYRINEMFGVGLDGKYNIKAKTERYGYTSDRSGLSAAVTARYYF